ncbi:hypothetical protein BDW75DRAFT_225710 [Aspergillus navahoensis]
MSFERAVNTLRFNPSQNYLKCLDTSTLEQIVLYDIAAGKAWLVPMLSVLHHMLLVYADSIHESLRVDLVPTVNPALDGASPSLNALKDKGATVVEASGDDALTIRELIMKFSVPVQSLTAANWALR